MADAPLPTLEPQTFGLKHVRGVKILVLISGFPDEHSMVRSSHNPSANSSLTILSPKKQWAHQIKEFENDYHIVSVSTPDFDRNELRSKWGYTLRQTTDMITACINKAIGEEALFDLLVHDWGSFWGLLIAGQIPARIRRLVTLDIGGGTSPKSGEAPALASGFLWQVLYQVYFATVFWIGVRVSTWLADRLLMLFIFLSPAIGPMGWAFDWGKHMPRPLAELKWWMCYPYYQVWFCGVFVGRPPPNPKWPAMPTLFIYGKQKRCMFHTAAFEAKMKATEGNVVKAYDCAHWIMHEKPKELNADLRSFLIDP